MIKERFYYSLKELSNFDDSTSIGWNKLFGQWSSFESDLLVPTGNTYNTHVFDVVKMKNMDDYIAFIDIVHPEWENVEKPTIEELKQNYSNEIVSQLAKMSIWVKESTTKYQVIINNYEFHEAELMKKIESESTNQFNDTPQTNAISGLRGDNFATTYSISKSSSDGGTTAQRLNEIRILWDSVYNQWSSEFAKKFIMY